MNLNQHYARACIIFGYWDIERLSEKNEKYIYPTIKVKKKKINKIK